MRLEWALAHPQCQSPKVAKGRLELPRRHAARRSERRVSAIPPLSHGVGCEGIEPLVATLLIGQLLYRQPQGTQPSLELLAFSFLVLF